jgi:type III secretory pathway component EscS
MKKLQERFHLSFTVTGLLAIFFLLIASSHWMACAWGYVATSGPTVAKTWISLLSSDGQRHDAAHSAYGLYLTSLYFSAMTITTVGYGDIHPLSNNEHVVCILMMLLGGIIWAYVIGVLTAIVSNLDQHGTHFKQVSNMEIKM